jgi:hypothetical protein
MKAEQRARRKLDNLTMPELTIETIALQAIDKAGGKRRLCREIGISRTTLDSILEKNLKRRNWSRTINLLTAYALKE